MQDSYHLQSHGRVEGNPGSMYLPELTIEKTHARLDSEVIPTRFGDQVDELH